MNKPRIYGFCPAGCKWETVHKNDFDAAKACVPILEDASDHTHHLIQSINLLEENPYADVTQHFKIYDGTVGATPFGSQWEATEWNVKLHAVLYINGQVVDSKILGTFAERTDFDHEIDLVIKSINYENNGTSITVNIYTSVGNVMLWEYNSNVGDLKNVTCDIYVENLGYPHDENGVTTERIDGCENTRVYSVGYGNGIDVVSYVGMQLNGIDAALDNIIAIIDTLAPRAIIDGEEEQQVT